MALTDESIMAWGKKYAGEKMANVPASYLDWILRTWQRTDKNRELFKYIFENLDAIRLELKAEEGKKNEQ